MLRRNGFCILFVILYIAVCCAVVLEDSFGDNFYEEQGKLVDVSQFQQKIQLLSEPPTTKRPSKPKPPSYYHMPYPMPPPMYWPPYPPPQYPPPQYSPPQYHTPTHRPSHHYQDHDDGHDNNNHHRPRPSRRRCTPPTAYATPAITAFCQDIQNSGLDVCDRRCISFPEINMCKPICSVYSAVPLDACSTDCGFTTTGTCALPPPSTVPAPTGCAPGETFPTGYSDIDCELWCLDHTSTTVCP